MMCLSLQKLMNVSPIPVKVGSTCNNYVNSFNCTCTEGYTGIICETGVWPFLSIVGELNNV